MQSARYISIGDVDPLGLFTGSKCSRRRQLDCSHIFLSTAKLSPARLSKAHVDLVRQLVGVASAEMRAAQGCGCCGLAQGELI